MAHNWLSVYESDRKNEFWRFYTDYVDCVIHLTLSEISSKAVDPSQMEVIGCILHTTSMH